MLPYPSGEPHIGHLKVYSIGDAVAHYKRRNGYRVMHPMGYDAFGLPAENNAIKTGVHPRDATNQSIASYRHWFRRWGISIDWTRELSTSDPSYYRWTQWIFLKLLERGLAYRKEAAVKWCPKDATVLANEQVIDGRCERCGTPVEVRQLEQWFFRITDYADRLLDDLEGIDWPEHVKTMQRNWIGRSEGAEVTFRCEELGIDYPVFTTRPDTLFGATFFVLAPEHPDVFRLAAGTPEEERVHEYVNRAIAESAEDRSSEERPKTGVPLGRTVTNPVNGEQIPMFVADYVLMEYGTGAIMAVPAHDQRDHDFATAFGLEIRRVVEPTGEEEPDDEPFVGHSDDERLINSGDFTGMSSPEATRAITEWLAEDGRGRSSVNYRLRDWLLSRQRYWGCPIPVVYCDGCGLVPVPEDQLPVLLPDIEDYAPKGRSPLASAEDWVATECPRCGGPARRETDTMDTFVDSSWYFLRYCDARNDAGRLGPRGGAQLDARRPVHRRRRARDPAPDVRALLRQGARRHEPARRAGALRGPVHDRDDHPRRREDVELEGQRGRSRRLRRALRRRHRPQLRALHRRPGPGRRLDRQGGRGRPPLPGAALAAEGGGRRADRAPTRATSRRRRSEPPATPDALLAKAHWAIDKVTRDIERGFQFNTAIAAVMELVNDAYRLKDGLYGDPAGEAALRFATATAGSLLFPFAPHLGAEVYEAVEGRRVWEDPWPKPDPAMLESDTFTLVVQVNGKLRARVEAAVDAPEEELVRLALSTDAVKRHLDGKEIVKEVVVPGKLVNLVVR